jgi:site-specific DNA-cytosine methylase
MIDVFQQSSLAGRGTFGYDADADATKPVKTQGDGQMIVASTIDEGMARPLVSRSTSYRMDLESENFVVAPTLQRGGHSNNPLEQPLIAHPLRASDGHHGWSGPRGDGDDNLIADPISTREQKTWTHEGSHNFRTHNLIGGVRRLTPLECERLQGFPDGWTAVTADDQPIADAHRYRMLGNAVATVVAQWVGHRLAWVDAR